MPHNKFQPAPDRSAPPNPVNLSNVVPLHGVYPLHRVPPRPIDLYADLIEHDQPTRGEGWWIVLGAACGIFWGLIILAVIA